MYFYCIDLLNKASKCNIFSLKATCVCLLHKTKNNKCGGNLK